MKKTLKLAVAFALISQALAQSPSASPSQQAEALYQKGLASEKAGDPAAARKFYTEALKLEPKNPSATYSLGQLKITAPAITTRGREVKFGTVVIPRFQLDQATLQEALEGLSVIIEKESKGGAAPNFVIEDPKGALASQKVSLNLKMVPAKAVLKYLTDQAGAKVRYDEHAVVISPR